MIVGPQPVQVLDVTGPIEVFPNADGYDVTIGTPDPGRMLETNRRFALADAATTSALEEWIAEAQRRAWFRYEISCEGE